MTAPPTPLSPPSAPCQLFARSRRWLKRVRGQFVELVQTPRNFHALQEIWNLNIGRFQGSEIGRWMAPGYLASISAAIRQLLKPPQKNPPKRLKKDPKECVSLLTLLRDIQENAGLFTRARLQKIYTRPLLLRRRESSRRLSRRPITRPFSLLRRGRSLCVLG
jgi:hypothetical protein